MRTVDRDPDAGARSRGCFEAAVDVERWPALLPHYRWVRMLERRGDGGLVEMAAWRPFGPVRYPTWWVSEMWVDRAGAGGALPPRAGNHHGHGRGLADSSRSATETDVTIVHEWTGPAWPLIGSVAAATG